jgi:outer membrane protein W
MKGFPVLAAVALQLAAASTAAAQSTNPPSVRADVFGSLGWLNVNKGGLDTYNDWYNRSLYGGATFGWFWTEHLKTEVDAGASTTARLYGSREIVVDGQRASLPSHYSFSTRRISISQQYQFGENAWFHPHLGAGVDFNWERASRTDLPGYIYNPTRLIHPGTQPQETTDLHTRPFVAGGFKAYMTNRAFFRSDLRIVASDRIDEVLWRFGLGFDF